MKSTVQDMTTGNSMKLLARFFFPILIGNFFQQFYSFVDSVIVGKGIGDHALAAVGNTSSVHFLIFGFAIGLTGGLGICISQSFGAKDYKRMHREMAMAIFVCFAIGILMTTLGLLSMRSIFTFLKTPANIFGTTLDYFRIVLLGATITIFNNFVMTLLRSVGDSKTPLYAMIVSSIVNVILDLAFVFLFHLGVAGASLATVIAQMVSMLFCIRKLRLIPELHLAREDFSFQPLIIQKLLVTGIPVAIMNSITASGCMVLQYFVNGMGEAYTAAYAAGVKLCVLFEQPCGAIGLSVLTYVGQNFGAQKIDRIKQGVRSGLILSLCINLPIAAVMMFASKFLASMLLTDATLISYTQTYLFVGGCAIAGLGFLFVFRSACQGMGNTIVPMTSGILEVLMRIGVSVAFVPLLQFTGVALAEISAWLGAWIMLMITYFVLISKAQSRCSTT